MPYWEYLEYAAVKLFKIPPEAVNQMDITLLHKYLVQEAISNWEQKE